MSRTTVAALLLMAIGAWAQFGRVIPETTAKIDRPSESLAAAVAPIQSILAAQKEDGRTIATFYLSLADVVARDQGRVIRSAADLREVNRRAGALMFQQTGMTGKYPALATAIEKVLADVVGLENTLLDDSRRTKAVEAFRAIAWAAGGGHV